MGNIGRTIALSFFIQLPILFFQRLADMSYFRLPSVCHFLGHSNLSRIIYSSFHTMESIEQKAKLIDERLQQLKSFIQTTGMNQES